jgi:hypothetical protein
MYIAYPDVASALSRPRLGKYSILTEPYQLRVIAWKMEVFWEKYTGFNPHSAPANCHTTNFRSLAKLNWRSQVQFPTCVYKKWPVGFTKFRKNRLWQWRVRKVGSRVLRVEMSIILQRTCWRWLWWNICCLWVWVLSYARKYWKLLKL